MPCYVPSRSSDNIKTTRHHYIYSPSEKQSIIIDFMVPAEENLAQANFRKKLKYEDLIQEGQSAGWETKYFPVEVGLPLYLLQVLRPNKHKNQKGTGLCCKNSPQNYLHFVACKKHQAIWKLVTCPYVPPTNPIEDE